MASNDKMKILEEIGAFNQAWNRGDAGAAASFFSEDGTRIGVAGDIQTGRIEIEAAFRLLFGQKFAGAQVSVERGIVRMLSENLAVWQGGMKIQPAGNRPALTGAVIQIMKKTGTRWLIFISDAKFFPPLQG
jgi:uncharacterized protein (TIGR02246 family)